jgi:hypothetical protein
VTELGGRPETAMGLARIGDQLVTSLGGRNRLYEPTDRGVFAYLGACVREIRQDRLDQALQGPEGPLRLLGRRSIEAGDSSNERSDTTKQTSV